MLWAQERPFTVIIDPGHGGRDPGAVGATSKEKDIVLSVGLKLGRMIERGHPDVKVLYTRNEDRFVELNKRAEIANKAKGDLFISIHCNAVDRRHFSPGVETFVLGLHRSKDNLDVAKAENASSCTRRTIRWKYEGFNPNEPESYIIFEFMANEFLDQSVRFATMVQNQLVSNSQRENRDVRQAGFLVLREVAMPSVLVELGYISHRQEENYLKKREWANVAQDLYLQCVQQFKREHDKKSHVFGSTGNSAPLSVGSTAASNQGVTLGAKEYRVQFLTSSRKYESGASVFKGLYPVDVYKEGTTYKYTFGSTTSQEESQRTLRQVRKKFKDAFIVEFIDGKRVK